MEGKTILFEINTTTQRIWNIYYRHISQSFDEIKRWKKKTQESSKSIIAVLEVTNKPFKNETMWPFHMIIPSMEAKNEILVVFLYKKNFDFKIWLELYIGKKILG